MRPRWFGLRPRWRPSFLLVVTVSTEFVRRLRFRLFRWLLLPALGLLALRLPPGQDLVGDIVEAVLSGALQADVEIGRLRTNLWDDLRLQNVTVRWHAARELRLDRLALQMKSGPPYGAGPSWVAVDGVFWRADSADALRVDSDGRESHSSDTDLRRWLPDTLHIRDVHVGPGAAADDHLALTGWLSITRQADAAGGIANLRVEGDSLRLGMGTQQLPMRLGGNIAIGRRWLGATLLSRLGDDVDLQVQADYEAGAFTAQVRASGSFMPFQGLLPEGVRAEMGAQGGQVRLSASAHGPLADPLIHFDLALRAATVR